MKCSRCKNKISSSYHVILDGKHYCKDCARVVLSSTPMKTPSGGVTASDIDQLKSEPIERKEWWDE